LDALPGNIKTFWQEQESYLGHHFNYGSLSYNNQLQAELNGHQSKLKADNNCTE